MEQLAVATLKQAAALTDSPLGFVAAIAPGGAAAECQLLAVRTREGGTEAAPSLNLAIAEKGGEESSFWTKTLRTGEPLCINELAEGHAPPFGAETLSCYASVPVLVGGQMVGAVAVANAPGGYVREALMSLDLLAKAYALSIRHLGAQAELRFLKQVVQSIGEAVTITDLDNRLLFVNNAFRKMYGYTDEELIGKHIGVVISPRMPPENSEVVRHATAGGGWQGELWNRRKDGTEFPILLSTAPVLNDAGQPIALVGVVAEITNLKRSEAELRASEARLAEAQRVARLGSWEADLITGDIRWSEECYHIYGVKRASFKPTEGTFWQLVHPDDREMLRAETDHARERRGSYSLDYRILWPDGSPRIVHEEARTVVDAAGMPVLTFGTVQDVTDRKRLEEQLAQALKMEAVGRLAAGVAHDFNNVLTVILGYAELLGRQQDLPNPAAHMVTEIRGAAEKARSVTAQLLAFGRKQQLKSEVVLLNDIVAESLKMLRRLIGENVELSTDLGFNLGAVKADPTQLHQVILNLAVNARDAMPDGGRLTIRTSNRLFGKGAAPGGTPVPPGAYVLVSVSDTGHGMDQHTKAHIFEPFFTTKKQGRGTGLGLSTVYGIVRQSGGYIWVESEPGRGATFTVCLPRTEEPLTESAGTASASAPESNSTGTILIAEDEGSIRALLETFLSECGYTVMAAPSGEDALRMAKEHGRPIDLLLSDVIMPGIQGPELAEQLSALQPGLKVLYMSGYSERDLARSPSSTVVGAELMPKPLSLERLAAKIRKLVSGS